jgi:hypothetical protein
METEEGTANPWITISKRKRSRISGAQYDAAQDKASKSERAVEKLPTNGFLNLSLQEPGADDEGNGQARGGAENENTTRPSSSEGAVPPRKKTKKEKVSLIQIPKLTSETPLSHRQSQGQRSKPKSVTYSTRP